jgi:hypothetical protein
MDNSQQQYPHQYQWARLHQPAQKHEEAESQDPASGARKRLTPAARRGYRSGYQAAHMVNRRQWAALIEAARRMLTP